MNHLADQILDFLFQLKIESKLPRGVQVLNPYHEHAVKMVCTSFYKKYYSDNKPRTLIIGINPGRLGGGLTGIPFTDPIRLQQRCGIENDFPKRGELSSEFIYHLIEEYGGEDNFYNQFYFSSVSPLGFTKDGKNLNYYDLPALQKAIEPFAIQSLRLQGEWSINKNIAFCLGEGDNFRYLTKLNTTHKFFDHIEPLPHPRFIMQYKRKSLSIYFDFYLKKLMNEIS